MDKSKGLILWVAGFAGVFLLYSAYKGKWPLELLEEYARGTSASAFVPSSAVGSTISAGAGGTKIAQLSGGYADADGFVYDADGFIAGQVPASYAATPHTYIPSVKLFG